MRTQSVIGSLIALLTLALNLAAGDAASYPAVKSLLERAKATTGRTARVPLGEDAGRVPNFVRALHLTPKAQAPMQNLFDAMIYQGAIEPEIKLALGLRVAQIYDSPYLALHTERRLRATERGRALLSLLGATPIPAASDANSSPEALAIGYGESLTKSVHGVTNDQFAAVRTRYNDGQIVELTTTTCMFNYLVRFVEALSLPAEPWAFEAEDASKRGYEKPESRVALISDQQMAGVESMQAQLRAPNNPASSLGVGFANSMRAMLLNPAGALAWRSYGAASREYASVDRPLKLHISFAVSMANGCRYCTVHQVVGLKKAGVSPTKLLSMQKEDSQLTPRERLAVDFARKSTRRPNSITDADYAALKKEFGDQGALEIVMQTANFAFMNRFTDGLRLPSEDEAVHIYQEVYGEGSYQGYKKGARD